MKNQKITFTAILLTLGCFAFLSQMQAVSPAPDGCYPNYTTAEGCDALKSLSGGAGNTAFGWRSLFSDTSGSFNTGLGAGALILNNGDSNTAVGAVALLLNSTGAENTAVGTQALLFNDASYNTAAGAAALFSNTTGNGNTATGNSALQSNTGGAYNTAVGIQSLVFNDTGSDNTAVGAFALFANQADENTAMGYSALFSNSTGGRNTAAGNSALFSNTSGFNNTAVGDEALYSNSNGFYNVAIGDQALYSNTGSYNVAIGEQALYSNTSGANVAIGSAALAGNTTGCCNTAIGDYAGSNHETGNGNVYIGQDVFGNANENDTTYIRNIYNSTANARQVYVNSDNKVGTLSSSRRYKENIEPMNKASEALLALKPVTFRYKKEIDRSGLFCFGLIAEEVAQISPDLVTCDGNGQAETVRYDAVNAMLLNEFLKEHKKVEQQQAAITELKSTVAQQQKQIETLAAGLQKVSAHLELRQAAPQVATNSE